MAFLWVSIIGLLIAALFALLAWPALRARKPPQKDLQPGPAPEKPSVLEIVPKSCFVEVDGLKIHYTQAGSGPDIVLLHGIGASVYVWRFLFPLLQTHARVTAIDIPGFGKSTKDATRDHGLDSQSETLARTLTAIGISNATLVGSSMGGAIALWMAKRNPERFRRVVAIGPATDPRLVPIIADSAGSMAPVLWRFLNRHSMRLILSRVVRRSELITDECIDRYLEPFRDGAHSLQTFWSALALLSDKRLPDHLSGIEAEVLVLYGARDKIVPRASIDRLLKVLPQAKFEAHPDGGHHVMEDEPEWSAEHILSFVGIADRLEPKIQQSN